MNVGLSGYLGKQKCCAAINASFTFCGIAGRLVGRAHLCLDAFDIMVAKAEMMSNFMDQDAGDEGCRDPLRFRSTR